MIFSKTVAWEEMLHLTPEELDPLPDVAGKVMKEAGELGNKVAAKLRSKGNEKLADMVDAVTENVHALEAAQLDAEVVECDEKVQHALREIQDIAKLLRIDGHIDEADKMDEMADKFNKDLNIVFSVQIHHFGQDIVNLGELKLSFLAKEDTDSTDDGTGYDETRVFCRTSTWAPCWKVLQPPKSGDVSHVFPKTGSLREQAEWLESVPKQERKLKIEELKLAPEHTEAVQKASVCAIEHPTLAFELIVRKPGAPTPSYRPSHKHADFLDKMQKDTLSLVDVPLTGSDTALSDVSVDIECSHLSDLNDKTAQLKRLEPMIQEEKINCVSEELIDSDIKDELLVEINTRAAETLSKQTFEGNKLKLVLQADNPVASTWHIELHDRVSKGKLSRPSQLSLPPRTLERLGIPVKSEYFSYMYPEDIRERLHYNSGHAEQSKGDDELDDLQRVQSLKLLAKNGAFVYFKKKSQVKGSGLEQIGSKLTKLVTDDSLSSFDLEVTAVKRFGSASESNCFSHLSFSHWIPVSSDEVLS